MNSDKDVLDHMLIIVGIVCWLVFYSWGICWVWTLLPPFNDHAPTWWFFPMVLTSLAGLGLPLAIFIVLDKIFGWTND